MKKYFDLGNKYLEQSDWKDLALIKFCLCSMGIIIGTQLPQKHKKAALWLAAGVFTATYIPLMAKLVTVFVQQNESNK